MTDFYLDPESGSDAGAGTSFATRWKTLTAGATAARIAPGDRIKVIASRTAYSLGNATFTDASPAITLAAAKTMNIDTGDSTGWTASASVTKTTTTFQTDVGTSITVSNFNIASGFTTGKVAYKAFGAPLDLSAYTAIGCLVFTNTAITTNMKLRLCSDATGDVSVLEIPFRALSATSIYAPFFYDNVSALPSGINSVSIFSATDPGTITTFRVINIFAGQSRGHADHIAHECLIGKGGSEPYYPVAFIDGTKITTNLCHSPTVATPYYYRGTTETVPTSIIDPLRPYAASTDCVLQDTGTTAAAITISGGWDRTDMSTQSGVTWWSGYNSQGTMLNLNAKTFINVEKIGYTGCATNFVSLGAINVENKTHTLQFEGFVNGVDTFTHTSSTNLPSLDISVGFINTISGTAIPSTLTSMASVIKTKLTVPVINNVGIGIDAGLGVDTGQQEYNIGKITNAATAACRVQSGARLKLGGTTFLATPILSVLTQSELSLNKPTLAGFDPSTFTATVSGNSKLRLTQVNGDPKLNLSLGTRTRYYTRANSDYATGTKPAWTMQAIAAGGILATLPDRDLLGRVYCVGGVATTVSVYIKKSDATLASAGIGVKGGDVAGVNTTEVWAPNNTSWNQVSITFTPTYDSVVEVFALYYSSNNTVYATYDEFAQV